MKLIATYKAKEGNGREESMKTLVWPDSAIIRSGKPLFIADDETLRLHPGMGVRITGVGKSISPKFAHKYYDEVFPVIFLLTDSASGRINKGEDPNGCDLVADYSIIAGDSIPGGEDAENLTMELTAEDLTKEASAPERETITTKTTEYIREAIAVASRRNTIKTGDIVAYILPGNMKANQDTLLKVSVNGSGLIANKLK